MVKLSGDLSITVMLDGEAHSSVMLDGEVNSSNTLDGEINSSNMLNGEAQYSNMLDGEFGVYQKIYTHDTYDGETNITPSDMEQVLRTSNKVVADNIIIQPIPSNYGKISWNGAYLTVE